MAEFSCNLRVTRMMIGRNGYYVIYNTAETVA